MCNQNHGVPTVTSIATPELGTRSLHYADQIGLSPEQRAQILAMAGQWRRRYVELVRVLIELGQRIDEHLLPKHVDRDAVAALVEERAGRLVELEREFVVTWQALNDVMTPEQHGKLNEVYLAEFEGIPHPVLGSSAVGEITLVAQLGSTD